MKPSMPTLHRINNINNNYKTSMTSATKHLRQMYNKPLQLAVSSAHRGGEGGTYADSNPDIFLKVGLNVIAQTGALLGAVYVGAASPLFIKSAAMPVIRDLPLTLWLALISIIFGSSFFGSIVEGGLSQATKQVLNPNVLLGDPNWYNSLKRPSWEPPGWVFPIMWVIVSKPTQLIAVSRLISQFNKINGGSSGSIMLLPWRELIVYCTHLSLGDAWNKVFFGSQSPGRGVVVITTFLAFLIASSNLFFSMDQLAGKFMIPTCAWVCIASALNWYIYFNNKTKVAASNALAAQQQLK
jgi:tryptophan-rich sensory protein